MAGTGGAFNELEFLTNIPILYNDDNRDSIFNQYRGQVGIDGDGNLDGDTVVSNTEPTVIFKKAGTTNTRSIKNYYKDTVYKYSGGEESDLNPYLKLIRDFEAKTFNAMRFSPGDLSYLTDLGVYPLNRMWVLRRFNEGCVVPNNLQEWVLNDDEGTIPYPISTIVGWIDPEETDFFNIGFNEQWEVITDRLDEVIMKILQDEFGFKAATAISVPGFSQGLLFAFLQQMGLTDFNSTEIPMGNPAVLQEALGRAKDADAQYANKSTLSFELKTSYEQKFIGDIDPGNAMMDLIQNCIYMGTRDTEYVFRGDSDILKALRNAAGSTPEESVGAWWDFITVVLDAFMNAMTTLLKQAKDLINTDSGTNEEDDKKVRPGQEQAAVVTNVKNKFRDFKKLGDGIAKTILASTVAKWRYALMGSIALMTGENSTPWHLTIGNPYSPFVTMGNAYVKSVNLNFNNEMGFNDIPTKLNVTIKVDQGRNMGAQEIFQMFNNGYNRVYVAPKDYGYSENGVFDGKGVPGGLSKEEIRQEEFQQKAKDMIYDDTGVVIHDDEPKQVGHMEYGFGTKLAK